MKKKDLILVGAILLVALISWGAIRIYRGNKVMTVSVPVESETQGTTQEVAAEGETEDTTQEAAEAAVEGETEDTTQEAAEEAVEGETKTSGGEGTDLPEEGVYGIHILAKGEDLGVYPLTEDKTIDIGETNTIEIKDGAANMVHAECPDQLCVHMGAIKDNYGLIVCLPNEVIVEGVVLVPAKNEVELDGIS